MAEMEKTPSTESIATKFSRALDDFAQKNDLQLSAKARYRRALTSPYLLKVAEDWRPDHAELLGDHLLNLKVAESLTQAYPSRREFWTSKSTRTLTRNIVLSRIALETGLNNCMIVSDIEARKESFEQSDMLADALERFMWVLHKDAGEKAVEEFVQKHILPLLPKISELFTDAALARGLTRDHPELNEQRLAALGVRARYLRDVNPWIIWEHDGASHPYYPLKQSISSTPVDSLRAFRRDEWDNAIDKENWRIVPAPSDLRVSALHSAVLRLTDKPLEIVLRESPIRFPGGLRFYALYLDGRRIVARICPQSDRAALYDGALDILDWRTRRNPEHPEIVPPIDADWEIVPPDPAVDKLAARIDETIHGHKPGAFVQVKRGETEPHGIAKKYSVYVDGKLLYLNNAFLLSNIFISEMLRKLLLETPKETSSLVTPVLSQEMAPRVKSEPNTRYEILDKSFYQLPADGWRTVPIDALRKGLLGNFRKLISGIDSWNVKSGKKIEIAVFEQSVNAKAKTMIFINGRCIQLGDPGKAARKAFTKLEDAGWDPEKVRLWFNVEKPKTPGE